MKTTLMELIKGCLIGCDKKWAIYAESWSPDAPARIGDTQFENGGVLDGFIKIIDGQSFHEEVHDWTDGTYEFNDTEYDFLEELDRLRN